MRREAAICAAVFPASESGGQVGVPGGGRGTHGPGPSWSPTRFGRRSSGSSQAAPKGVYRGLAQYMGYGSYVAACAEVSVDGNKVKVLRIIGATDPGYAVNPAQIERQIAGSFVYGLTALFNGECTVKDGAIEQTNFDT